MAKIALNLFGGNSGGNDHNSSAPNEKLSEFWLSRIQNILSLCLENNTTFNDVIKSGKIPLTGLDNTDKQELGDILTFALKQVDADVSQKLSPPPRAIALEKITH